MGQQKCKCGENWNVSMEFLLVYFSFFFLSHYLSLWSHYDAIILKDYYTRNIFSEKPLSIHKMYKNTLTK